MTLATSRQDFRWAALCSLINAEISPATGSVEQGEHSDPLGVRAEERVPSQLCARAAEVVKACRDDLRKLEQEEAKREERQWAQMQEARSILTRSSTSPAVHAAPAAPAALLR